MVQSFVLAVGSARGKPKVQATDAPVVSPSSPPASEAPPPPLGEEEIAYLAKISVKRVSVEETSSGYDGVFGEIWNDGDRELKDVEITIYGLDNGGNPVFEKTITPAWQLAIKPGKSRRFAVPLDDVYEEWSRKKVRVKATRLTFGGT